MRPSYPDMPAHGMRRAWRSGTYLSRTDVPAVQRAQRLADERGRPFDIVGARLPADSWNDVEHPTAALTALRQVPGRKVLSVPVLPDSGGSLRSCEKGRYHSYWRGFAQTVADKGLADAVVDLRPDTSGAALRDPAGHAACYRRVVQSLRTRLPRVSTQWSVPRGVLPGQNPVAAWPGADVVTIVGVDAIDTGDDWGRAVNGEFGLNWWAEFARAKGRQVALAQWGVFPGSPVSAANAPYVQNIHDWLVRMQARKQLAYEAVTTPGPSVGAAATTYRSLFSG